MQRRAAGPGADPQEPVAAQRHHRARRTSICGWRAAPASRPLVDRISGAFKFEGPGGHGGRLYGKQRPGHRQLRRGPDHARCRGGGVWWHRDGERVHRASGAGTRARVRVARHAPTASICGICRRGSACRSWRPIFRWRNTTWPGQGPNVSGNALLKQSTVEGDDCGARHDRQSSRPARDGVSYAARGRVAGLNVRRVGNALRIAALDKPAYDGTLNGDFDVDRVGAAQRRRAAGESRVAELITVDATRHAARTRRSWADACRSWPTKRTSAGGALNVLADGRLRGLRSGHARQSQGDRRQGHAAR